MINASKALTEFHEQGYAILPQLLSEDETDYALWSVNRLKHQAVWINGATVIPNLQSKDQKLISLLENRSLQSIAGKFLNDPYYEKIPSNEPNFILGDFVARSSGKQPLPLHIDSWMPSTGERGWMMQIGFALEDRGEPEGCTVVVPNSHRSGKWADRQAQAVPLPLKARDAVIWDSRLWHGAKAKTSTSDGWFIVATLQAWWVKQRFDIPRMGHYQSHHRLLGFDSIPPTSDTDPPHKRAA